MTSSLSFLNMPILQYSSEIRSAVLLVHGEKAHSRYFSETAYNKVDGGQQGTAHSPVPATPTFTIGWTSFRFEKLKAFFEEYLK